MNKLQLRKLLTIEDPHKETIYGVIGRMKVLLDYFEHHEEYRQFTPFLATYYYVTKAAAERYIQNKHYFWSQKDYEVLDVYFASLYFKPLLHYLVDGKIARPWETYFTYCAKAEGVPFIQMLLGINAHINADLYTALVDLSYKHRSDFFLVNDILQEVTPSAMHYLALSRHDVLGLTAIVWKHFALTEFHNIVERWRSEAWAHAALTDTTRKKVLRDLILDQTEVMGQTIVKTLSGLYHIRNIPEVLATLHALSVEFDKEDKSMLY